MGHSFLERGTRKLLLNDWDILGTVAILVIGLEDSNDEWPRARVAVTAWRGALGGYGPGCIDLRLSTLDDATVAELRELASSLVVGDNSVKRGLSAECLNRLAIAPGIVFAGLDPAHVVQLLESFDAWFE